MQAMQVREQVLEDEVWEELQVATGRKTRACCMIRRRLAYYRSSYRLGFAVLPPSLSAFCISFMDVTHGSQVSSRERFN